MGDMLSLTAEDGHTLAGYRAAPQGKAARAMAAAIAEHPQAVPG
jgi:hypothetical protein